MKVAALVFALVVYEVSGRPSDPVFRVFGTQPDNPNVKVFSTYPTAKPVSRIENPNDLEKGTDDGGKVAKDEEKGEITPKGSANKASIFSPDDAKSKDISSRVTSSGDEAPAMMRTVEADENAPLKDIEDSSRSESVMDNTDYQEENVAETLTEVEVGSEGTEGVRAVAGNEGIFPISIESPANTLPPLVEEDIQGNDPYLGDVQNPVGVELSPAVEPMAGVNVSPGEESLVIPSDDKDPSFLGTEPTSIGADGEENIMELIKPIAEVLKKEFGPLVEISDHEGTTAPTEEFEDDLLLSEGERHADLEPTTTEYFEDNILEEVGASEPMVKGIHQTEEEEIQADLKQSEPQDGMEEEGESNNPQKQRFSIKIKVDDEVDEVAESGSATEEPVDEGSQSQTDSNSDKPIQMAGFMADFSKADKEENVQHRTEEEVPAAIKEAKTEGEELDLIHNTMSVDDQLNNGDEETMKATTTESVPSVNPEELMTTTVFPEEEEPLSESESP